MYVNAPLAAALDRIAERAADVRRAFEPGATPARDDVASTAPSMPSLDPLSVGVPDAAYLIVGTGAGNGYTRDGALALRDGSLVDASGRPVLGITGGTGLSALVVDPVDAALGRAGNARIEADGTFAYDVTAVDPRTGDRSAHRVAVGRVALARFPPASRLLPARDGTLAAPAGVSPHVGMPGDGTFASLAPMHRTGFGIGIDAGLARLEEAYVAFDALQAAETAKGRLGKTAMDLLK